MTTKLLPLLILLIGSLSNSYSQGAKFIKEQAIEGSRNSLDKYAKREYKSIDKRLATFTQTHNISLRKENRYLYTSEKKGKIMYGINIGLLGFSLQSNSTVFDDFDIGKRSGFNFNFYLDQKIWKPIYLRFGFSYMQRRAKADRDHIVSEFYSNEGEIINLQSELAINQIYVPVQVKINIIEKKWTPYFLGGVYFGVGINNSVIVDRLEFNNINNQSIQSKKRVNPFNAKINVYELGWKAGFGLEYYFKELKSVYAEFQITNGKNDVSSNSLLFIRNRTIGILLGVNL